MSCLSPLRLKGCERSGMFRNVIRWRVMDRWACWSSFRRRQSSAGSCRPGTTCRWTRCIRRRGCHRHAGTSSRSYCAMSDSRTLHANNQQHHPHPPIDTFPANYRPLYLLSTALDGNVKYSLAFICPSVCPSVRPFFPVYLVNWLTFELKFVCVSAMIIARLKFKVKVKSHCQMR